jgi:hypothetical protein
MKRLSCIPAFAVAALVAVPAYAAVPATLSPEATRVLAACGTFGSGRQLSPSKQALTGEVVRGIVAVELGEGIVSSPQGLRSMCNAYGYFVDGYDRHVTEGHCVNLSTGDKPAPIRYRICNAGGTLSFHGAWRETAREHSREMAAQKLRDLIQAVALNEYGESADNTAVWNGLLDLMNRYNPEDALADGACLTARLDVSGHGYDVKLCRADSVIVVGKGAVKAVPAP